MTRRLLSIIACSMLISAGVSAQSYMVDKVVAVVGGEMIKQSDINEAVSLARAEDRITSDRDLTCKVFEEVVTRKLMLAQSKLDSIEIDQNTVEMQLNQRVNYFTDRIGSQEKLEEYFGKNMQEIRSDLRKALQEEMTANKEKNQITDNVNATPAEVRKWFRSLPEDSIPLIPARYAIAEIGIYPPYSEESLNGVREKLLDIRKRILEGEKFTSMAVLYSEDPGSAISGGELGFMSKGSLDPAYAKVAWELKPNEISRITETPFGLHLIQMIEKRGELANTRHILMRPTPTSEEKNLAFSKLDSIRNYIIDGTFSFDEAVRSFSSSKNTRNNRGLMINQNIASDGNGGTWFRLEELPPLELRIIRNLKEGEISDPYEATDENGRIIYKIIRVDATDSPHSAEPSKDYDILRSKYIAKKQSDMVKNWINEKAESHFVRIDDSYKSCPFLNNGHWLK